MRAIQITNLSVPDCPRARRHPRARGIASDHAGQGVLVDVHAAGVAFPEVLQTRGEYQFKPPLPFVPGSEVPAWCTRVGRRGLRARDRVAAFCFLGGFAEVAVSPA